MLHLGDILDAIPIEHRGLALMLNVGIFDLPNDIVINIGDVVRIVASDGSYIDTPISGVEARHRLTLLLDTSHNPESFARDDQVFLLR